jgi:hypothetical protein
MPAARTRTRCPKPKTPRRHADVAINVGFPADRQSLQLDSPGPRTPRREMKHLASQHPSAGQRPTRGRTAARTAARSHSTSPERTRTPLAAASSPWMKSTCSTTVPRGVDPALRQLHKRPRFGSASDPPHTMSSPQREPCEHAKGPNARSHERLLRRRGTGYGEPEALGWTPKDRPPAPHRSRTSEHSYRVEQPATNRADDVATVTLPSPADTATFEEASGSNVQVRILVSTHPETPSRCAASTWASYSFALARRQRSESLDQTSHDDRAS